jgi:aminotransferase
MTICAPAPLQAACAAVLGMPDEYYAGLRRDYTQRRDKMISILQRAGFSAHSPEGAFYAMADFSAWDFDGDDYSFARWLSANLGLPLSPVHAFMAQRAWARRLFVLLCEKDGNSSGG